MQEKEELILIYSKDKGWTDKTAAIKRIYPFGNRISITFAGSDNQYNYDSSRVKRYKVKQVFNTQSCTLCYQGSVLKGFSEACHFGEYVKVFTSNGSSRLYLSKELEENKPLHIFSYLKTLADRMPAIKSEDEPEDGKPIARPEQSLQSKAFSRIDPTEKKSTLQLYLSGELPAAAKQSKETIIYPFGCNASQKSAVQKALNNRISVIEGPPGTGKTQTILNVIANAILRGKKVAVVSNNNAAVANVQEKLQKGGYDFLTAMLGKSENQKLFFEQKHEYTLPQAWKLEAKVIKRLNGSVQTFSSEIERYLKEQNRQAELEGELSRLNLEYLHLKKENTLASETFASIQRHIPSRWNSQKIIRLKVFIENHLHKRNWLNRLKLLFHYKSFRLCNVYKYPYEISLFLDEWYYVARQKELKKELKKLEKYLLRQNFNTLLDTYIKQSRQLFHAYLANQYSNVETKGFQADSFKDNFEDFTRRFPVILSTVHSILNSAPRGYLFDYLIIDESSQVDIVTASLAFSCCKNAVIIGDTRQLSHITVKQVDKVAEDLIHQQNISKAYDYKLNVLASIITLFDNNTLPHTLLKEHYRCQPKIIEFCNQKFYQGQLVIMSKEKEEDQPPFKVYTTVSGNHVREIGGKFLNQRQIDLVAQEIVAPLLEREYPEIGIISPYRYQADEMGKQLPGTVEVDTIHKFQGREKERIVFTTVKNKLDQFMDDPNLVNVAVSRAKSQFIVVKPAEMDLPQGSNLGDLLRYIQYVSASNSQTFVKSQVVSVFDLLYQQYTKELLAFRKQKRRVSQFDSENLMYDVIQKVLAKHETYQGFGCAVHYRLNELIASQEDLTMQEKAFLNNGHSHLDFLIYNHLDKSPVLAIEVDGTSFHLQNPEQQKRDALKNSILDKRHIPWIRFATNGSNEFQRLEEKLQACCSNSLSTSEK